MKHTPGPWTPAIYKTTDSMFERLKTSQWSVALNNNPKEPQGLLIALCGDGDDKQSMADAHLIAAAPEMLEALKDIVEQYEQISAFVGVDLHDSISFFANKAITKAEGNE